jgi:hypothetical protein
MKKLFVLSLTIIIAICLSLANAFADECSKVIWNIDDDGIEISPEDGWKDIFENNITIPPKPKNKDLIINVSLECKLVTNTLSTKKMSAIVPPLSEAEAEVMVHVLVDSDEAHPGEVTFARRFQALVHKVPDDHAHTAVVVLDTITTNSFNFIAEDVKHGDRDIVVQAKVVSDHDVECGGHDPTSVSIGKGSLIVECVKIIED